MQLSLENIYNVQLQDPQILCKKFGFVNQEFIEICLSDLHKFNHPDNFIFITHSTYKKIYSIVTELLENVKRHGKSTFEEQAPEGFVVITIENNLLTITSGNYLYPEDYSKLKEFASELSITDISEKYYETVTKEKGLTLKGGASIGLLDIALKANKRLDLRFYYVGKMVIFTVNLCIMEKMFIQATTATPEINFDQLSKILTISGESRPEDVQSFYKPVFDWIKQLDAWIHYSTKTNEKKINTSLTFNMTYFNSSSVKIFIEIMDLFKTIEKTNENCTSTIIWKYNPEDEDIYEAGLEIEKMSGIKIEFAVND